MRKWLRRVLDEVHRLACERKIRVTLKAAEELGRTGLGLDVEDLRDVLTSLEASDSAGRVVSASTGEWMYVFKPSIQSEVVYLKVILRGQCVVVTFHREGGEEDEEHEVG